MTSQLSIASTPISQDFPLNQLALVSCKDASETIISSNTSTSDSIYFPNNQQALVNYENTSAISYNQYKTKPTTIKGSNSNSPLAVAPRGHWAKVFATGFPTDTTKYNVKKDLEYNIEYYTGKK